MIIGPILTFDMLVYLLILFCLFKDKLLPKLIGKAKWMVIITTMFMLLQLGLAITIMIH